MRLSALQTLPQITFLQNNNIALIEKFQTISGLTIPAWQRQLMLALNILDQKKYSQLGEEIDNFTNETLLESAKDFKETSIHIAKQSNRQVIDIETLQKVQLDTLTAFEEVMAINKTSAQKRKETQLQAQQLNDQLKSLVVADPQQLKISAD
uniref:toxic anion resistance protein n=1 Tax=Acinetobacter baumannii TaxID=470 RepID=UPI003BEF21D1